MNWWHIQHIQGSRLDHHQSINQSIDQQFSSFFLVSNNNILYFVYLCMQLKLCYEPHFLHCEACEASKCVLPFFHHVCSQSEKSTISNYSKRSRIFFAALNLESRIYRWFLRVKWQFIYVYQKLQWIVAGAEFETSKWSYFAFASSGTGNSIMCIYCATSMTIDSHCNQTLVTNVFFLHSSLIFFFLTMPKSKPNKRIR